MAHKLSIILCNNYLKEAEYVVKSEGLEDIEIISYPANCMKCMLNNKSDSSDLINNNRLDKSNAKIIFCTAVKNLDKENINPVDFKFKMCYSILAGETMVNNFNQQGFYILTPGWLINWEKYVIDLWKFDNYTAKAFFKESASKLMLLDTGLYEDISIHLKEFSEFTSLDYMILPVGIDYFRNYIMNIYLEWQNETKEKIIQEKSKHLAEFAFMFDMILEINKLIDVEEIIHKMFDLFVMLTGASKILYFRVVDNEIEKTYTYRNAIHNSELFEEDIKTHINEYKIKKTQRGFILKVNVSEETFDYLEVDDVAISENIDEYVKMSSYVFKICALVISNRKEHYKLIKSNLELEEESKTQNMFFANISHELRTPINVLFSGIQLFESRIKSNPGEYPSRSMMHLKSMKQNCFRLLRLVNNVIDITKIESKFMNISVKNVNIVSVIEEVTLSVAEYASTKGIYVEFDTEDEEIIMSVDIEKIDRIFFNLFSNAVKFTKQNGSIFVNISRIEDHIIISVKDTGIGIPEDKINQIFERFVQVENTLVKVNEGSGIGLAIVKSLVEMHEGKITVTSNVGIGTEFIVELPIKILHHESSEHPYSIDRTQSLVETLNIEFSDIYSEK